MEEFTLISFSVTDKLLGIPQPFIPDGSVVLLVQDGSIQFSLYEEPTDQRPYPSFSHPKDPEKNKRIESELKMLIKQKYPDYWESKTSIVLTCPARIAEKVVW